MPKQTKGWKWRITRTTPDDSVFMATMDKDQAMELAIGLYQAIQNPENTEVVFSMTMNNFNKMFLPTESKSDPK